MSDPVLYDVAAKTCRVSFLCCGCKLSTEPDREFEYDMLAGKIVVAAAVAFIVLLASAGTGGTQEAGKRLGEANSQYQATTKTSARTNRAGGENPVEIDSEHMFGFTMGSDIGDAGELEGEIESDTRLGKRAGKYAAASIDAALKYTVIENFRISPAVAIARHDMAGVPGLDDRHRWAFEGAAVEFKKRFLERERGPFGLTLGITPHWSRIDDGGARVAAHGVEVKLLADKELVKDKLFGAFNVLYEPAWTRVRATGAWERDSTVGVAAALTSQIHRGVFLGGEARYLRKYEGTGLNTFAGDAFFLGPTLFATFPGNWNMTFAWNVQVAGRAAGEGGSLDLTNFERHQVLLRFGKQL